MILYCQLHSWRLKPHIPDRLHRKCDSSKIRVFIKVWQQEFFLLYFLSFHSRIDIGKIKLKRSNKDQWKQFKQQVAAKNWNQEAITCCFGRFSCTKESPILTVRMKKYEPLDMKNFVSFTDFYELSLENRTIFIVFPETLVMFW